MPDLSIEEEARRKREADHAGLITDLVAEFSRKYGKQWGGDVEQDWWDRFRDVPEAVLLSARDDYFGAELYAPDGGAPAAFAVYVSKHSSIARRSRPSSGTCPHCDGIGWLESKLVETAVAARPSKDAQGMLRGPREPYRLTYSPGMYPCPHCQGLEAKDARDVGRHQRWHEVWIPEGRHLRPVRPDDLLGFNPAAAVLDARRQMANAGSLAKDPDRLL